MKNAQRQRREDPWTRSLVSWRRNLPLDDLVKFVFCSCHHIWFFGSTQCTSCPPSVWTSLIGVTPNTPRTLRVSISSLSMFYGLITLEISFRPSSWDTERGVHHWSPLTRDEREHSEIEFLSLDGFVGCHWPTHWITTYSNYIVADPVACPQTFWHFPSNQFNWFYFGMLHKKAEGCVMSGCPMYLTPPSRHLVVWTPHPPSLATIC